MFIEFPDHDFQFLLKEEDKKATIKWLKDNGVTTIAGDVDGVLNWCTASEEGHYFTVRNKKVYMAFSSSSPQLPIYKIQDKNKTLFLNILVSILKELGYYRKGMKDPVIKFIIENLRNYNGNFQPQDVINMTSFRSALYLFLVPSNNPITGNFRLNEEAYKALSFYKTIYLLTVSTYLKLSDKDGYNITENSYVVNGVVRNSATLGFSSLKFNSYSSINSVTPKEVVKYLKRELKPVILSDDTLPKNAYIGLIYV